MMTNIHVSIVIPIHNEAHRLRETVYKIIRYGEQDLCGRYEIVLVENGSTDGTLALARELERTYQRVKALSIHDRSKASAVRYGMMMSQGEFRYMCDCDLSAPINELTMFLKRVWDGWDVVIASREHVDSQVETDFHRWFIGRAFSLLVKTFTGLDYRDTQCGFKLFTAQAAEDIFSRTECTSMAIDVEALYLARQLEYYTIEMPVTWINDRDSRVHLVRDSWSMLRDVMRIRRIHANEKRLLGENVFYKEKRADLVSR